MQDLAYMEKLNAPVSQLHLKKAHQTSILYIICNVFKFHLKYLPD